MRKILSYIEANLFEDLNVQKLASEAAYSSFHFLRLFYEITHLTPMEYIRRRRLTEAAIQLMEGTEKVIHLALNCGYGSEGAFIRAFKKQFGITPGQMKRYGKKEMGGFLQPFINWGRQRRIEAGDLQVEIKTMEEMEVLGFSGLLDFELGGISPYEIYETHKKQLKEMGKNNIPVYQYTVMWEEEETGPSFLQGFDSRELEKLPEHFTSRKVAGGDFACFTIDPTQFDYLEVDQYIFKEWMPKSGYKQSRKESIQILRGGGCPCHNTNPYRLWIPV